MPSQSRRQQTLAKRLDEQKSKPTREKEGLVDPKNPDNVALLNMEGTRFTEPSGVLIFFLSNLKFTL